MRIAVILVLLVIPAFSQNPSADAPPPSPAAGQQSTNSDPSTAKPPATAPSATTSEVPPDAPVMTLRGFCPSMPAATDQKSPECKTVVTRAEFDNLVKTLSPNMPGSVRQRLAQDYAQMLVLSDQAKKQGLDKTQKFDDIIKFMRLRVLAQEYLSSVQENSKPTPAEVEKYYQDNKGKYEELMVNRLFLPRNRPAPAGDKAPEPKPLTDAELQAQADKYRARLAAGESFEKVQKEAYEAAGFKTPPPPTVTSKRREGSTPAELELFSLKKGDLSKPILDMAGASIYQVQDTKVTPFEEVRPGIEAQLASERMRAQLENLSSVAKPEFNQAYFDQFKTNEPVRPTAPPAASRPSSGGAATGTPPKPSTPKPATSAAKPAPKK
jgi:hypothetical protein